MQEYKQEIHAMTITITLILCAFAALAVGCTGSSSSPSPDDPASPPPCYRSDEPNDSFVTPNMIVPEAPLFLVEGNIHAGDLDCIICTGLNGEPFNETGSDKQVRVQFDYAAGWDCDVYIGWQDPGGNGNFLWQAFDEWGQGHFDVDVTVPTGAGWLMLSIGQNTLNMPPDETRYSITVETF